MRLSLRNPLRNIFSKVAQTEDNDAQEHAQAEEADSVFATTEAPDMYMSKEGHLDWKSGQDDWSFQHPDIPVPEQFGKPVTLPNQNQYKLWAVYKYGGSIDLGYGEGVQTFQPEDPRVRGALMGQFIPMMHEATKRAIGNTQTSPGEVNVFHRKKAYTAIQNYDPVKNAFEDKDTGQVRATRLSKFVWDSMMPPNMKGGASGQRVAAQSGGHKSQSAASYANLARARPIIDAYKLRHDKMIDADTLARTMGVSRDEAKRILVDAAPEYDTGNIIDDMNTVSEEMLPLRDALVSTWTGSPEHKRRILEWLFPDMLTPKIPVPHNNEARMVNGKIKQTWMAKQLGVGDYKVTRWKNEVMDQLQKNQGIIESL